MNIKQLKEKLRSLEDKLLTISIILAGISILSKLLGFFKVHLIARLFGTSQETDIFYAAFALPDLVFALLVVGTVNAALVPVFIKIIRKGEQKTLHTTLNTVITLLFVCLCVVLGILYFQLPKITNWIFSSKEVLQAFELSIGTKTSSNAYYQNLFVNLSRLMLISPLLLAVSSVFGAYLQAHKRFISTALAPFMYNLGILLGMVFFVKFAPYFGIYSLGYSVLLGTILHFITQFIGILSLHENDFSWTFSLNPFVKEIGRLSLPRIFGLGVEQLAIMFNTFWGFTLGTGALTVFKFASTLYLVPVDLLSGTLLQVIFPRLNERAHENDNNKSLNALYWRTLLLLILVAIPVIILFLVLRLPIVRLVLGAERFSWTATLITSFTLTFFTPAILLQAVSALNVRTFYAIHNTKTPLLISLLGVTVNILFSLGFTNFFSHYHELYTLLKSPGLYLQSLPTVLSWFFTRGTSFAAVAGLAFGISLGLLVEVTISFLLLSKRIGVLQYARTVPKIFPQIRRLFTSGLWTLLTSYGTYRLVDYFIDTSRAINIIWISLAVGIVCTGSYLYFAHKIINEYVDIKKALASGLNRFRTTFSKS